jgi:hypothetical protein
MLNLHNQMPELSKWINLFYLEADFQFALASEIQKAYNEALEIKCRAM